MTIVACDSVPRLAPDAFARPTLIVSKRSGMRSSTMSKTTSAVVWLPPKETLRGVGPPKSDESAVPSVTMTSTEAGPELEPGE